MTKIFNKKTGALSALSAVLLLAVIMPSMPLASADDTICTGGAAGTVTGTHDNVVVPSGAICFIFGATINGNVEAESGALKLNIASSTVTGNIEADGVLGDVIVNVVTVGGDVQIKNSGGSSSDLVNVVAVTIGGDLEMENNTGFRVGGWTNLITGNFEFNGNLSTGGSQPSIVSDNTVGENLECSGNTPVASDFPFGLNTVTGNAEGECATLI